MKMPINTPVVTKTQLIDALIEIRRRSNISYRNCLEWQRCHEEAEKLAPKWVYVEYPAVDFDVDSTESFKRILMGTEYKVLYAFFVNLLENFIPKVNKYYFKKQKGGF